jgi:hypothetical protein
MVVVFSVLVSLSRLEQEVTRCHLEYHAGKRPHVSRGVVLLAYNYLWGPVLPGLDLSRKMVISPASVAEITDLEF